jgi:hypothetical protein
MTIRPDEKSPCIYVSACRDCSGIPEAVVVRLLSGEEIKVEAVVAVSVTEKNISLQTAVGTTRSFARSQVSHASCARGLPPFPS